jgi:hypothetical protein
MNTKRKLYMSLDTKQFFDSSISLDRFVGIFFLTFTDSKLFRKLYDFQ